MTKYRILWLRSMGKNAGKKSGVITVREYEYKTTRGVRDKVDELKCLLRPGDTLKLIKVRETLIENHTKLEPVKMTLKYTVELKNLATGETRSSMKFTNLEHARQEYNTMLIDGRVGPFRTLKLIDNSTGKVLEQC